MWNRDLAASTTPHTLVSYYFDTDADVSTRIALECIDLEEQGRESKPFTMTIDEVAVAYPSVNDPADLADLHRLFNDAWLDGITAKDRVAVHLDTETDGCCDDCGRSVSHHEALCDYCGGENVTRFVTASVVDMHAETWANSDQTIDGSTWESDGSGRSVYATLNDRETLVDELQAEGYRLNLTNYT